MRYWYLDIFNLVRGPYQVKTLAMIMNCNCMCGTLLCKEGETTWFDGTNLLELQDADFQHHTNNAILDECERAIHYAYSLPPVPTLRASHVFDSKKLFPSPLSGTQWLALPPFVRTKLFYISGVDDVGLLTALHGILKHNMKQGATTSPFITQARDWMAQNDFVHKGKRINIKHPELTSLEIQKYQYDARNIDSRECLRLIYETNVRQCYGLASWSSQAMPLLIRAFPAYRFVRFPGAKIKRSRHEASEGEVRLKNDYEYWAGWHNSPEIRGLGVPWAPFGYNSYMQLQPVSRKECEQLGLLKPGDVVRPN